MVSLGRVAFGQQVRASASTRSHELRPDDREDRREFSALLAGNGHRRKAEGAAQFGKNRGDELPAELARRETRLETIRAAKAA